MLSLYIFVFVQRRKVKEMGRVDIYCCDAHFYNYGTKGGESGSFRCPRCGCVYGWRDIGGGETRVWVIETCLRHARGPPEYGPRYGDRY